jgi:hypothetical protein
MSPSSASITISGAPPHPGSSHGICFGPQSIYRLNIFYAVESSQRRKSTEGQYPFHSRPRRFIYRYAGVDRMLTLSVIGSEYREIPNAFYIFVSK